MQLLTLLFVSLCTFMIIIKFTHQTLNQDHHHHHHHHHGIQRLQQFSQKCRRRSAGAFNQLYNNRFNQLRLCDRYIQGTSLDKNPGDGDFEIRISSNDHDNYVPEREYDVELGGSRGFIMFQIVLESDYSSENYKANDALKFTSKFDVGRFVHLDPATSRDSDECPNAVKHSSINSKHSVKLKWLAPPPGSACVVFKATVAATMNMWFMDDGGLTRRLCPEESNDEPAEVLRECEACDEAKYQIIFKSLWSELTHPHQNLPSCWESYFSGIIGASHAIDYRIWENDGFASRGLKMLAEMGDNTAIELEIRKNSSRIRTIIRGRRVDRCHKRGQSPVKNCRRHCSSTFRVDKKNHLLSFVSKVVPSPDWIVGISSLELCMKNGSWLNEKKIRLHLYDAGTDSGIAYKSKPEPTIPPERIHQITGEMGRIYGPRSPFYNPSGGGRVEAFAEVIIKRINIYKRTCDDELPKKDRMRMSDYDSGTDDGTSSDNRAECALTPWQIGPCLGVPFVSGEQVKNRSYLDPGRAEIAACRSVLTSRIPCIPGCDGENICDLTNWGSWSACDNPCGNGYRRRRRSFVHPDGPQHCDISKLTESEECNEWSEYCKYREMETETMEDPKCITSNWSEWSLCNVSCGIGMKTRYRNFINFGAEEFCNKPLIQRSRCNVGLAGCDKSKNNFQNAAQEICLTPIARGSCPGGKLSKPVERWNYNVESRSCVSFNYTGCENLSNNFSTKDDCEKICARMLNNNDSLLI